MHIKVFSPFGWDFGDALTEMVKMSSRGLIGADRKSLIKRAGYSFVDMMDKIELMPGDVPLHAIAMGAHEKYGCNRNGDTWWRDELLATHHTFVKHARYFRNHQNKDPRKSYGVIKASAYNHPMDRVELLIFLNGTKEAAERNGGLIADRELAQLEKTGELAGSMACTVPYDTCSSCGNRAPTREDYCLGEDEGGHCKHGGCKNRLTRVCDDGHVLHVKNSNSKFIDYSDVVRPADRTAYGGVADYLLKAADGSVVGGAELAEQLGLTVPLDIAFAYAMQGQPQVEVLFKLACALAVLEQTNMDTPVYGANPSVKMAVDTVGRPGTIKFAEAMKALADEGIVLPLRSFAAVFGLNPQAEKAAYAAMTGIYTRLIKSADFVQRLSDNKAYQPARTSSSTAKAWAQKHASDFSLLPQQIENRRWIAALNGSTDAYLSISKQAADNSVSASDVAAGMQVAESFAIYQLSALCKIAELSDDFALTAVTALHQNHH